MGGELGKTVSLFLFLALHASPPLGAPLTCQRHEQRQQGQREQEPGPSCALANRNTIGISAKLHGYKRQRLGGREINEPAGRRWKRRRRAPHWPAARFAGEREAPVTQYAERNLGASGRSQAGAVSAPASRLGQTRRRSARSLALAGGRGLSAGGRTDGQTGCVLARAPWTGRPAQVSGPRQAAADQTGAPKWSPSAQWPPTCYTSTLGLILVPIVGTHSSRLDSFGRPARQLARSVASPQQARPEPISRWPIARSPCQQTKRPSRYWKTIAPLTSPLNGRRSPWLVCLFLGGRHCAPRWPLPRRPAELAHLHYNCCACIRPPALRELDARKLAPAAAA